MLKNNLRLIAVKKHLNTASDYLVYLVRFSPFRPIKAQLDLIVTRPKGGRWKFKFNVEATDVKFINYVLKANSNI